MAHDLGTAAARMANLVRGVHGEQLADPTPCDHYDVGALLDHIDGVTVGLTGAARGTAGPPPPPGDAAHLDADWRTNLPERIDELAAAWREPGAFDRTLEVGGIDMPAEAAFAVALEELVVHGWDLARATRQPYDAADDDLEVVRSFFAQFGPEMRGDAYGPEVAGVDPATELDRLIAVSGRDPNWSPS
jgi:uncharacterized protein (TIGR03086 family)